MMMALHLCKGDIDAAMALYRRATNTRLEFSWLLIGEIAGRLTTAGLTRPVVPLESLRNV